LLRAKVLKDTIGFENIYMCPDLTINQQEEDEMLRNQVRDFKYKGAHNRVKIIRGQVIGYVDGKEEVYSVLTVKHSF